MIERLMLWLLLRLTPLLRVRHIERQNGTPYLDRYVIAGWIPGSRWTLPFGIYLHRFHEADADPAPHNHPWRWAVSLILTGGYRERRGTGLYPQWRDMLPGSVSVLRDSTFHVVTKLLGGHMPTWTLFVVGPRIASWGFMVGDPATNGLRFMPWRDRLLDRGITPTH